MIIKLLEKIEESFPVIDSFFDDDTILGFLSNGYTQVYKYNHMLEKRFQENLLSDESELYMLFLSGGVIDKGDMIVMMLQLFYISAIAEYHYR